MADKFFGGQAVLLSREETDESEFFQKPPRSGVLRINDADHRLTWSRRRRQRQHRLADQRAVAPTPKALHKKIANFQNRFIPLIVHKLAFADMCTCLQIDYLEIAKMNVETVDFQEVLESRSGSIFGQPFARNVVHHPV